METRTPEPRRLHAVTADTAEQSASISPSLLTDDELLHLLRTGQVQGMGESKQRELLRLVDITATAMTAAELFAASEVRRHLTTAAPRGVSR